jgi:hypothetical protein
MASLTLSAGATTSTFNANNAKVAELTDLFIAEMNGPVNGTNQEKADFVVAELVSYVREVARRRKIKAGRTAAEATVQSEAAAIDWN